MIGTISVSHAVAELHVLDGVPQSIFVQSKYTIEVRLLTVLLF